MNTEEFLDAIDYDKLRWEFEFLMDLRMKDSPYTGAKFVMKFTNFDSALGKEIRLKKAVRKEFIHKWSHTLTHDEMRDIMKENLAVSAAHSLSALLNVMVFNSNKPLIKGYMADNHIAEIKKLGMRDAIMMPLMALLVVPFTYNIIHGHFWPALGAAIGILLCPVPYALHQREILREYLACIKSYIDRTGEEPDLLLETDLRKLNYE